MELIDSFYVDETIDSGGSRFYFKAKKCPFAHECSKNSWDRAKTTSFLSEEDVRQGIYEHLVHSGRHWKSDLDAKEASKECEVDLLEETQEERARYRNQIDQIATAKHRGIESPDKRQRDGKGKSKQSNRGGVKTKEKVNRCGGATASMSSSMVDDVATAEGAAIAERATDESHIVARQSQAPLNSQSLGLLIDCIDRSKSALENSQVMFQRAADDLQQRAQACVQASMQLQMELSALSAARDCVRDLMVRMDR